METKLASNRQLDRADLVQVMKKTDAAHLRKVRKHIAKVHPTYLLLFDELQALAGAETEQEKKRGGPR